MSVLTPRRVLVGVAAAALISAGVGTAIATTAGATPHPASSTSTVDTPEVGDTPDAPDAVDTPEAGDTPDAPDAVDTPEAGDTPDAPGQ